MTQLNIDGDLILTKDTLFREDLQINGNIFGENKKRYNIKIMGNITAWGIHARDIDAMDINVGDIDAVNINARDIDSWKIDAVEINARDVTARFLQTEKKIKRGKRK